MLTSTFAFSVMSMLVKVAGNRLPSMEVVLVRGVITLVLSYWAIRRAGLSPGGNDKKWLFVRGLLGSLGLHCYFYSVTRLPLADATVIQLTNPLLVAIAAPFFLGEKMRALEAVAVAIGLLGVVFISRPTFLFGASSLSAALDPFGLTIAIVGACISAVVYLVVRRLRATEHPLVVVLQAPLLTVPLTLPFVWSTWVWPTPFEWLVLLGVGIATQIGQVKMTEALHLEPAARATAVSYVQVLFAIGFGIVLFAEIPTSFTILGASAIALGTALILRSRTPIAS
jgi:drug/metabolite transporter (DMT)-like permease